MKEIEKNVFNEKEVVLKCVCGCSRKMKIIQDSKDTFSFSVSDREGYYLVESDFIIKKEILEELLKCFANTRGRER